MESSQILILVTVFVYLVGMLLIGVYFSRRGGNGSSHDFYLGGRSLGPVVTAMSAEASDMSSYLLMGLPGLAYFCGLPEVTWTCIGLATGTYLNWLIVARRIRRYSDRLGAITVPDFFSRRYGDQRHVLSCIAAIVILVFFIPYTASGFKAVGTLFNSLFGFEYHTAMIVGAVVIIAYTVMGGFLAVSTTDLVQSVFMTVALIVVVCFGVGQAGGVDAVLENARSLPGYLNLTQGYDVATGSAASFGTLSIFSTLAWGLGYFGMPHILLRFMAIREEKELNLSRRIATVWVVISMAIAIAIGVIGLAVTKAGSIPFLGSSAEAETIIIQLANLMSQHGFLLIIAAGVIISGILAATMSTADSQLLTAASAFASDVYKPVFRKGKASDKEMMWAGRIVVLIISVVALIIASNPNSGTIMSLVSNAWGVFGAAFGPAIMLSLFWKRFTFAGAVVSIIVGAAVDGLWLAFLSGTGIYEIIPAFAASMIAAIVASLLSKKPGKDVEELFDKAVKFEEE